MAVEIVSLKDGRMNSTSLQDLYGPSGKAALIKNMIFSNTDTQARTLSVYFLGSEGTAGTDERLILSKDINIPAGFCVIQDLEITLSDGDKIRAQPSVADKIDYVLNGIEREVV